MKKFRIIQIESNGIQKYVVQNWCHVPYLSFLGYWDNRYMRFNLWYNRGCTCDTLDGAHELLKYLVQNHLRFSNSEY